MSATPLAGIVVLDLTTFLSGPYAAMVLGQLGADVVKIEPPTGDPTRAGRPVPDSDFWYALHRAKRSVVLDLKDPADRQTLLGLVAGADIVLDNFRPGVVERRGIGPAELRVANPRIITCSITGYGRDGGRRDAPAIDGVVQASTGALELADGMPTPLQVADLAGGNAAAQAVLAALFERTRDGAPRHIELSLAECLRPWLAVADRSGTLKSPNTIVATTSDGARIVVQTPLHFRTRLADCLGLTFEPTEAYAELVRSKLSSRPAAEWIATITAAGIPVERVVGYAESLVAARHEVVDGRIVPVSPFTFDGARHDTAVPPPRLDAHRTDVLSPDAAAG